MYECRWLGLYAADGIIVTIACDSTCTSTFRTRYVEISLRCLSPDLSVRRMAASPSNSVHRRLRDLRPNFDVVFRLSVDAVSIHPAQNGSGRKETWEERWAVVLTEYRRRRDQVRRCRHLRRIYPDFLSHRWHKASHKRRSAYQSLSTARYSRRLCIRHFVRPLNLIVPAS